MAAESLDLPLGSPAPTFALPDVVTGRTLTLDEVATGRALLVIFLCKHCPYVQHILPEIDRIEADYAPKGLRIVGITSNDASVYPDDAPAPTAEMVRSRGWSFPVLYDESQEVARAYQAVCTPELYVFDAGRALAYHGQLDDSRHKNTIPLSGADLRAALDAVLAGTPVPGPQRHAVGCSIKWKAE